MLLEKKILNRVLAGKKMWNICLKYKFSYIEFPLLALMIALILSVIDLRRLFASMAVRLFAISLLVPMLSQSTTFIFKIYHVILRGFISELHAGHSILGTLFSVYGTYGTNIVIHKYNFTIYKKKFLN